MSDVTIYGPLHTAIAGHPAGSPDPNIKALLDTMRGFDGFRIVANEAADTIQVSMPVHVLTDARLAVLTANGFTFGTIAAWILIPVVQYDQPVLDGMANRIDPDTSEVRTWRQWHDAFHEHWMADADTVVVCGNGFGADLAWSEYKALRDAGYTVVGASGLPVRGEDWVAIPLPG